MKLLLLIGEINIKETCSTSKVAMLNLELMLDFLLNERTRRNSSKEMAQIPGFVGPITVVSMVDGKLDINARVTKEGLAQALSFVDDFVLVNMKEEGKSLYLPNGEMWAHGDCLLHAPGVYCYGNQVMNLYTCVRTRSFWKCFACLKTGATIATESPKANFHYPCAVELGFIK